jgi:hypothetical protein
MKYLQTVQKHRMLKWYRIADTFESIVGIDILYQYRPSLHSIGRHLGLFTQSLGRLPVVIVPVFIEFAGNNLAYITHFSIHQNIRYTQCNVGYMWSNIHCLTVA